VNPALLTITADNQTMVYGSSLPALTVTYDGFLNGDTPASLTTLPTVITVSAGSPVGNDAITVSGAVAANYAITYAPGTLAVIPAPLTIIANNVSRFFGAANPPLTASFFGFVNGDTPARLSAAPTLATAALASSLVRVSERRGRTTARTRLTGSYGARPRPRSASSTRRPYFGAA